jgi:hypothetical protein
VLRCLATSKIEKRGPIDLRLSVNCAAILKTTSQTDYNKPISTRVAGVHLRYPLNLLNLQF